jgi:hypothetical protein
MLVILGQWIILTILSGVTGEFAIFCLGKIFRRRSFTSILLPVRLLLGMGILAAWAGLLSLIIPLGWFAFTLTVLVIGVLVIIRRIPLAAQLRADWVGLKRTHPFILFTGLAFLLVILFWTAQVPENYDTGLYHAQAIRWLEEYGTVIGLGNLNLQLGYNSILFPLSALFSFSFLGLGSFHSVNGYMFAIFGLFLLRYLQQVLKGQLTISGISAVIMIYLTHRIYIRELSSPSTDLPAAIFAWLTVLLFLEDLGNQQDDLPTGTTDLIWLFSIIAVMFKLSVLPVILLPVYQILRSFRKSDFLRYVSLALLLIIPWDIRGVLLSGLPLYPTKMLDVFNFNWEIPANDVAIQLDWVRYYGRNVTLDYLTNKAMGFSQWFPLWWGQLDRFNQMVLAGMLVGAAGLFGWLFARCLSRKTRTDLGGYAVLFVSLSFSVAFWFLSSPLIRYGYGSILILFSVAGGMFLFEILKRMSNRRQWISYSLVGVVLLYQLFGFYKIVRSGDLADYFLRPADYPVSEVVRVPMGDFEVYMPVGEFNYDWCWYAPLPCTPVHDPTLHLRGETLGDGFYHTTQ